MQISSGDRRYLVWPKDSAVERLSELLGYVEQVIRLDEWPAFRLSDYRLLTGQTFVFHQHEFHALPGITHDLTDEDGAIWLTIQRLKRDKPPAPPEAIAPWLNLFPDPDKSPALRDSLIRTVSSTEKKRSFTARRSRPGRLCRSNGLKRKREIRC